MQTPQWLHNLLNHPEITDICLNGACEVFIDQGKGLSALSGSDSFHQDDALKSWVLSQISEAGKSWDARHPFIDATLKTGHRLHVTFPPIAPQGILVSLRRTPRYYSRQLDDAQRIENKNAGQKRWASNLNLYEKLCQIVEEGQSLIISGATGSGKTTLANDLIAHIASHERIIALEDTPELAPNHRHFISLLSRPPNADGFGEVSLRTLLKQTLRMRPDRIILGECRGAEVLDLLQALNTGHHGALATLHANSPRDALRRMELLCLLAASGSIPLIALRELLSLGVQWIVQVKRNSSGRSITELWKVEGREGETILMRPYN